MKNYCLELNSVLWISAATAEKLYQTAVSKALGASHERR